MGLNEAGLGLGTNEFAYLRNKLWWVGMTCMICGELCNFGAYAFAPAIIVTPLGAVSVVVSAILSYFLLGERLSFTAMMGILLCIIGSILIVLHAPASTQTETIPSFFSYVISPGFLVYSALALVAMCYLVFRLGPKYGTTQPLVFLSVTSISGAFLVNAAQGLGSSIVHSITYPDDTQFKYWAMYLLIAFSIFCAIFQINYLNKSLRYFSASMVTPVNYVFFSTATLITSAVLFGGMKVSSLDAGHVCMGFLIIVIGVSLIFQFHLKEKVSQLRKETKEEAEEPCEQQTRLSSETHTSTSLSDTRATTVPAHDLDPVNLWFQTYPLAIRNRGAGKAGQERTVEEGEEIQLGAVSLPNLSVRPTSNDADTLTAPRFESPLLADVVEEVANESPAPDPAVVVVVVADESV